jgi:hypothetical protein
VIHGPITELFLYVHALTMILVDKPYICDHLRPKIAKPHDSLLDGCIFSWYTLSRIHIKALDPLVQCLQFTGHLVATIGAPAKKFGRRVAYLIWLSLLTMARNFTSYTKSYSNFTRL